MEATLSILQAPASILACIGVVTVFLRIGRKDKTLEDHTQSIKEHGDALKKNYLTEADCREERTACIKLQAENNAEIVKYVSGIKKEVKEDRENTHSELIKIAKSIGRIEGYLKLRSNEDGKV